MNTFKFFLIFVLCSCCITVFQACDDEGNPDLNCVDVKIGNFSLEETGDSYQINSIERMGNCAWLNISFSGGCKEHDFELRSNGAIIKTNPLTAELGLWHNANDDFCEAWITKDIFFDLRPLQVENQTSINLLFLKDSDTENMLYTYGTED